MGSAENRWYFGLGEGGIERENEAVQSLAGLDWEEIRLGLDRWETRYREKREQSEKGPGISKELDRQLRSLEYVR